MMKESPNSRSIIFNYFFNKLFFFYIQNLFKKYNRNLIWKIIIISFYRISFSYDKNEILTCLLSLNYKHIFV